MVCQINSVKDELVVAWIDGMASQIGVESSPNAVKSNSTYMKRY